MIKAIVYLSVESLMEYRRYVLEKKELMQALWQSIAPTRVHFEDRNNIFNQYLTKTYSFLLRLIGFVFPITSFFWTIHQHEFSSVFVYKSQRFVTWHYTHRFMLSHLTSSAQRRFLYIYFVKIEFFWLCIPYQKSRFR